MATDTPSPDDRPPDFDARLAEWAAQNTMPADRLRPAFVRVAEALQLYVEILKSHGFDDAQAIYLAGMLQIQMLQ